MAVAVAVAVAGEGVTTTYHCCSIASAHRRLPSRSRLPPPTRASGEVEVCVCTNRKCARQGGREVLAALVGLVPPRVDVASCGCLGRCGAGPNVASSVAGKGAAVYGHMGLEHFLCPSEFDATAGLAVLAAREKADITLEKGF